MYLSYSLCCTTPREVPPASLVSWGAGVMGRTQPPEFQHELLQVIAHVARRYNPGSLPCDSREHQRLVRGCFVAGISLTGREARTVMGRLVGGMVLPLPFHSRVLAYCRMVHLCYGCTELTTRSWRAMGLVCTYIVHMIPEFAEEGCTATLCMHGGATHGSTHAPPLCSLMRQGRET